MDNIKFSEQSSRTNHALGNIELHELGQISRTANLAGNTYCRPQGLIFCSCGTLVFDLMRNKYKESKPDSRR